jgi:hypothetical protein
MRHEEEPRRLVVKFNFFNWSGGGVALMIRAIQMFDPKTRKTLQIALN